MATNNFKPFAVGAGANVTAQADYEALAALVSGFTAGKASSAQVNKALRQSTVLASVLAQFIANTTGKDVLDNGDTTTLLNNLITALKTNGALSFLQTANNFSEIKSAGATAVSAAIANLGISANLIPVGIPLPWSTAIPPTGWLKCNGSSFSTATYPNLAIAYPSGILPDLRGEFIRGWDDGRGVDTGRAIISNQSGAIQSHSHVVIAFDSWDTTVFNYNDKLGDYISSTDNAVGAGNANQNGLLQTSRYSTVSAGSAETRPLNIAFSYIVRAA